MEGRRPTWELQVESYSGYKVDERPQRFQLGEHDLEVLEILDRWYDPKADYFKVRADDGNCYILKNHSGRWTLECYQRAGCVPERASSRDG